MIVNKNINRLSVVILCYIIFTQLDVIAQNNIIGDSLFINLTFNNRLGLAVTDIKTGFIFDSIKYNEINLADKAASNININKPFSGVANPAIKESQPFWLKYKKEAGSFTIPEQADRVLPIMQDSKVYFSFKLNGEEYTFEKPLEYKYIDPVKGEIYQPSIFTNPVDIKSGTSLIIKKNQNDKSQRIKYNVLFNKAFKNKLQFYIQFGETSRLVLDTFITKNAGENLSIDVDIPSSTKKELSVYGWLTSPEFSNLRAKNIQSSTLKKISYSHIPDIFYHYTDSIKILYLDIKTTGKNIGYIVGAGDKVPEALKLLGYNVSFLSEQDVIYGNLVKYDAIVTGIRAYNTLDWLDNAYNSLMNYVEKGGQLVVQYNTNNRLAAMKTKMFPYPFTISRSRITDENAEVNFIDPTNSLLNYPNKITKEDFNGWIQERSIYNAENIDSRYETILSMKDPGEAEQSGSLIAANYGKGKIIYTGLVFFRELPAGVPGAFKLFANIISNKNSK